MIPKYPKPVPAITTQQMIEVDRLMIEEYHIQLIQMMENAGRCLAIVAREKFLHSGPGKVLVLAGTGGNGGGAMVCARRLAAWGHRVTLWISSRQEMTTIPAHQLDILERMKVTVMYEPPLSEDWDLLVDGVIGYSLHGDPRGMAKEMIDYINQRKTPTLSLDTPSGLDLMTGKAHHPMVRADATLTLALPKMGLLEAEVQSQVGRLFLGDISVPPILYRAMGIDVPVDIFTDSDIVQIVP